MTLHEEMQLKGLHKITRWRIAPHEALIMWGDENGRVQEIVFVAQNTNTYNINDKIIKALQSYFSGYTLAELRTLDNEIQGLYREQLHMGNFPTNTYLPFRSKEILWRAYSAHMIDIDSAALLELLGGAAC